MATIKISLVFGLFYFGVLGQQMYDFPTINNDELLIESWIDKRSYGLLEKTCNFSKPCAYGSMEPKWSLLNGSLDTLYPSVSALQLPDFPAIGFGTHKFDVAHLFSDPLPCYKPDTANMSVKIWFTGQAVSYEMCLVAITDGHFGKCGAKISNFNTSFQFLNLFQPIRIKDNSLGPYVAKLRFEVLEGFVIVDDLEITGEKCDTEQPDPLSKINYRDLVESGKTSRSKYIVEELSTVLCQHPNQFGSYLIELYKHNNQKSDNGQVDKNICSVVPCNFDCDWSKYNSEAGTVELKGSIEFLVNKRGIWQQRVQIANFRENEIGYAILTSPKFRPIGPNKKASLTFKFNRAAKEKQLIVCFFVQPGGNTGDFCNDLERVSGFGGQDWYKTVLPIPNYAYQFQIVVSDPERKNGDPELDQSMIQSINVIGC